MYIHVHVYTYKDVVEKSLTLISRQRLERVWADGFITFFTCTHYVATPSRVSHIHTRFASLEREREREEGRHMYIDTTVSTAIKFKLRRPG